MPLNNLSRNTKTIKEVNLPSEEIEKLKKKISTLTSKITKLNTDLRVKDGLIMDLTGNKEYDELKLIEDAIIDKVKAFNINIRRYCETHKTTEIDLLRLPRMEQPKNLREKVDYLKILEGLR